MSCTTYTDFDAFSASIRDADVSMMMVNPAERLWRLNWVDVDGLNVQSGMEGCGNISEGQAMPGGYLFFLPLSVTCEYRANGKLINGNALAVLEPESTFCIRAERGHNWASVFVPTERLARTGAGPKSESGPPHADAPQCRVIACGGELAGMFGSAARQVITAAACAPSFKASPAAEATADRLTRIASLILSPDVGRCQTQKGRRPYARQDIIERCHDLLMARVNRPVRSSELVAAAGVSEKTLQTIFKEYFGVGPHRYLQLRQLFSVRRALKSMDPAHSRVSDALVNHGVWEFGRFSGRYRQLFAESPSQTLQRPS